MPKRILLISYDERVLIPGRALLEQEGYSVASALGLKEAVAGCKKGPYDLLILGYSIPIDDKERLIEAFRANSSAPILSLWEHDEQMAYSVDYLAFSGRPERLLGDVASILSRRSAAPASR
jgi:DNA-binding response OmpR family regulator